MHIKLVTHSIRTLQVTMLNLSAHNLATHLFWGLDPVQTSNMALYALFEIYCRDLPWYFGQCTLPGACPGLKSTLAEHVLLHGRKYCWASFLATIVLIKFFKSFQIPLYLHLSLAVEPFRIAHSIHSLANIAG